LVQINAVNVKKLNAKSTARK